MFRLLILGFLLIVVALLIVPGPNWQSQPFFTRNQPAFYEMENLQTQFAKSVKNSENNSVNNEEDSFKLAQLFLEQKEPLLVVPLFHQNVLATYPKAEFLLALSYATLQQIPQAKQHLQKAKVLCQQISTNSTCASDIKARIFALESLLAAASKPH